MKANSYEAAKEILKNHLEQNKFRKTPERLAILKAVYGFSSYFSIQELDGKLAAMSFPVCRATLYNTMKLFMNLHLVVSLRFHDGIRYKACYSDNMCVQVCTVCGRVTEVKIPDMVNAFENARLKRFRKESYSFYIYGICSTCQAMLTRQKRKRNTNNENKHF